MASYIAHIFNSKWCINLIRSLFLNFVIYIFVIKYVTSFLIMSV